jgi:Immunity protein 7
MFEFHGWAVLTAGTGESDPQSEQEITAIVQRRIDSDVDDLRCAGVASGNLLTSVWFHGQYNHPRPGPLNFLRFIGEQAAGAYGVLFLRDDDDDPKHLNEYRVWRLARGEVTQFGDPFLSPCVPTIEDADQRFTLPE